MRLLFTILSFVVNLTCLENLIVLKVSKRTLKARKASQNYTDLECGIVLAEQLLGHFFGIKTK